MTLVMKKTMIIDHSSGIMRRGQIEQTESSAPSKTVTPFIALSLMLIGFYL